MSFISLTVTSLCDSNSQPSSTEARLSLGNTTIPPTAHNSNTLQQAYCSMVCYITVKNIILAQYFIQRAFNAHIVFLLSFLLLCPPYCQIKQQCPNEKPLCHTIKQMVAFKAPKGRLLSYLYGCLQVFYTLFIPVEEKWPLSLFLGSVKMLYPLFSLTVLTLIIKF